MCDFFPGSAGSDTGITGDHSVFSRDIRWLDRGYITIIEEDNIEPRATKEVQDAETTTPSPQSGSPTMA